MTSPPPPQPQPAPSTSRGLWIGLAAVAALIVVGGLVLVALFGLLGLAIFANTGDGYLFASRIDFAECVITESEASTVVTIENPLEDQALTNIVLTVSFTEKLSPKDFEEVASGQVRIARIEPGRSATGTVLGSFRDDPPRIPPNELQECRWSDIDYDTEELGG